MSRTVNPYVDWLDTPESVSRPNYYQLLGIPEFEDDEKKIKGESPPTRNLLDSIRSPGGRRSEWLRS